VSVSPAVVEVQLVLAGEFLQGATVTAMLSGGLEALYDERGSKVVALVGPIPLLLQPLSTFAASIDTAADASQGTAITVAFSRPVSKPDGTVLDGTSFNITVASNAAFGPRGATEPVSELDGFTVAAIGTPQVADSGSVPGYSTYQIEPSLSRPATGVERISVQLSSNQAAFDDRGANVPAAPVPFLLNATRDPALDEKFDASAVVFPPENVVDLVEG